VLGFAKQTPLGAKNEDEESGILLKHFAMSAGVGGKKSN